MQLKGREMGYEKETVAARLRSLRAEKHVSQREVAAQTGINVTTIGNYENAVCGISFENALRLADYYNIPIGGLCGRDEANFTVA